MVIEAVAMWVAPAAVDREVRVLDRCSGLVVGKPGEDVAERRMDLAWRRHVYSACSAGGLEQRGQMMSPVSSNSISLRTKE